MDVKHPPQMQGEDRCRYLLFAAIDRATRWVFVQIKSNTEQLPAPKPSSMPSQGLPNPHPQSTHRKRSFAAGTTDGSPPIVCLPAASANHEFERLCQQLGIKHRLTRPGTPRTNGTVERLNGRIAGALRTHRFNSAVDLEQTLLRYVHLYNHQLPQSALRSKTPTQAMKQ